MTTSHWQRPHSFRVPDVTTDVLVVGGGYVGLATAYWLTEQRPDLKVALLERRTCGAGASGRNAGFLTMGSASFYKALTKEWGKPKAQAVHRFAQASIEYVYQEVLKASPEVKYERSTSMTLFQTDTQHHKWQDRDFSPEDFGFQWRNAEQLPLPLQSKFFGAYENGPEFKVNPVQLLESLKKLLASRKVQIIEHAAAFEITADGVLSEIHTIKARQVVLALNGYFPEFHPAFREAIVPRRAQMLAVELEDEFDCPGLYYDPPQRVYWRKTQEKVLVIGGKRLLDESGETGNYEKVTAVIQQGLESYLRNELKLSYKVLNRWSGIMGFTSHELPFLDRIRAPLETYAVGGFSGHGMGLGFHAGKEMAELVTGVKSSSFFSEFSKADFKL